MPPLKDYAPVLSTVEWKMIRDYRRLDADQKCLFVAALQALADGETPPDAIMAAFEMGLAQLRSGDAQPPLSGCS